MYPPITREVRREGTETLPYILCLTRHLTCLLDQLER